VINSHQNRASCQFPREAGWGLHSDLSLWFRKGDLYPKPQYLGNTLFRLITTFPLLYVFRPRHQGLNEVLSKTFPAHEVVLLQSSGTWDLGTLRHFDWLTPRNILFQPPFLKVSCGFEQSELFAIRISIVKLPRTICPRNFFPPKREFPSRSQIQ